MKIKESSKDYSAKDGTLIISYTYQRPVLTGNTDAIKKINKFYKKLEKAYYKIEKEYYTEAYDLYKEMEDSYYAYGDGIQTEITYNKNGIISILQSGYCYTGGAHGLPYRITHTFDLNTGEEMNVTDLMSGTKKEIKAKIEKRFKKSLSKLDYVFEEAMTSVKNTKLKEYGFYLGKKGITFYYIPGDLAPYAAGYIEAIISYSTKDTFGLELT